MNITKGVIQKAKKVVIYGPEGIGKSTFASRFPDPLFIDTEGSTLGMDVARLDKPTSWELLTQQIDFVKINRPCKTLVIDTVDWAERLAIESVCSQKQKSSITEFGYGEGFIQLEEKIGRFLNHLSDLVEVGINVVLSAHAKINKFEQPDEMGAYDRWELKLGNKTTAKTAALVKEWADMVLFANYQTYSVATDKDGKKHKAQGGKRVMYTTHHPCWDAKNRSNLPDKLDFDYSAIAHLFVETSQAIPQTQPVTQQPVLETPPQEEIQQLNINDYATPQINTVQQANTQVDDYEGLPQALIDLMKANHVTTKHIQAVVIKQGYYPANMPVKDYPEDFKMGCLVGAWDKVYALINDLTLPF